MKEDTSYKSFYQVFREVCKEDNITIPKNTKEEDNFLSLINNPLLERKIYRRVIGSMMKIWEDGTIKIEIQLSLIYEVLLKDFALLITSLGKFHLKYPKFDDKGFKESRKNMRKAQNKLMLAWKLFDPSIDSDGIKRFERQLDAFDECEEYLNIARDFLPKKIE